MTLRLAEADSTLQTATGVAETWWGRNVDEVLEGASPADLSDTILKFNLQWDINDDIMVYGTWSEGYRPGGFNRNGGSSKVPGVGPFVPDFYQSDEVLIWSSAGRCHS